MINHRKFANFEGASLGLMKSFAGDQKHEIVMQSWIESARTNPGLLSASLLLLPRNRESTAKTRQFRLARIERFSTLCPSRFNRTISTASVAQLVEQLICNQPVVGSNPSAGSFATKSPNYSVYDYVRNSNKIQKM